MLSFATISSHTMVTAAAHYKNRTLYHDTDVFLFPKYAMQIVWIRSTGRNQIWWNVRSELHSSHRAQKTLQDSKSWHYTRTESMIYFPWMTTGHCGQTSRWWLWEDRQGANLHIWPRCLLTKWLFLLKLSSEKCTPEQSPKEASLKFLRTPLTEPSPFCKSHSSFMDENVFLKRSHDQKRTSRSHLKRPTIWVFIAFTMHKSESCCFHISLTKGKECPGGHGGSVSTHSHP